MLAYFNLFFDSVIKTVGFLTGLYSISHVYSFFSKNIVEVDQAKFEEIIFLDSDDNEICNIQLDYKLQVGCYMLTYSIEETSCSFLFSVGKSDGKLYMSNGLTTFGHKLPMSLDIVDGDKLLINNLSKQSYITTINVKLL